MVAGAHRPFALFIDRQVRGDTKGEGKIRQITGPPA